MTPAPADSTAAAAGTAALAPYAATVFLSACLLFLVQPIVARVILPWFGGGAAVWTTCMLFFQGVLLLGYAYAHWSTAHLPPRLNALVHALLLAASLLSLPLALTAAGKPAGDEAPLFRILGLLGTSVGLPYLLLSSTSPLIQSWYGRKYRVAFPYRLFALSNVASLVALVLYPAVIEPYLTTGEQTAYWSLGYAAFVVVCGTAALLSSSLHASQRTAFAVDAPGPGWQLRTLWVVLAACPSALMLAVTNHLTQNVAPVPFLWILPLALYLLTFVLCFERDAWYRHGVFLWLLAPALVAMGAGLLRSEPLAAFKALVALYATGLFVVSMFFHGELARRRPPVGHLTSYYLMLSAGGALGGVFVALIAPHIFSGYFELPYVLGACAALAVLRKANTKTALALAGTTALVLALAGAALQRVSAGTRLTARNFYGSLLVRDSPARDGAGPARVLIHGSIIHGTQLLAPGRAQEPTMYYGPQSGAGLALALLPAPARVGLIGLGAGTLATYGRPGDYYRFYEINPLVIRIARSEFSYLRGSAARVDVVPGDARLSLEREAPQRFDLLAVDAFSGDSIPVHLLTRDAFELYFRHLDPGGVLALHISNMYLDLQPVVCAVAAALRADALTVNSRADAARGWSDADWMLVTRNREFLESPRLRAAGRRPSPGKTVRPWTDDYSNLFQVLR